MVGRKTTKRCSQCKRRLPATEEFFNKSKTHSLGLYTWCRACTSDKHQYHKYGLLPGQRHVLYVAQDGLCNVCKEPVLYSKINTDHNHETGEVRGLLCIFCNTLVGYLEKHPDRIKLAEQYIKRHEE